MGGVLVVQAMLFVHQLGAHGEARLFDWGGGRNDAAVHGERWMQDAGWVSPDAFAQPVTLGGGPVSF